MPPIRYSPQERAIYDPNPASKSKPRISLAGVTPVRSNAGGAVRGQARAAQVHALNATRKQTTAFGKRKGTTPLTRAEGSLRPSVPKARYAIKAAGSRARLAKVAAPARATARMRAYGAKIALPAAASGRSPGFNPFGVPVADWLDNFFSSRRKR